MAEVSNYILDAIEWLDFVEIMEEATDDYFEHGAKEVERTDQTVKIFQDGFQRAWEKLKGEFYSRGHGVTTL